MCLLATQTQLFNQGLVPRLVLLLQVVEQTAPLAHQQEQAPAGVMVLCVDLEMLGEATDALREESYLDLGRTGIGIAAPVLLNDLLLSGVF